MDVVVANLGTEHRVSGQDLHYYYDAARAIKAKIGPRICLHGTSSVSNNQIGKLFEDGICTVNIWTALERDASPALTEWIVKNAAKVGGPKTEQKLIDEGYLTESSKTGNKSHFTTAARQEIIFKEMKKITAAIWICGTDNFLTKKQPERPEVKGSTLAAFCNLMNRIFRNAISL